MKDAALQAKFYKQVGASIRHWRKKRNLSQDALARLIGLKRTSLTNIENGGQHPPLHTFCEIAAQLEVAVSQLLPGPPIPVIEQIDVKALAGQQVRGEKELAFIATGIGIERSADGDTKKKNSGARRRASR